MNIKSLSALLLMLSLVLGLGSAHSFVDAPAMESFFPTEADPFMGDYRGRWSEDEEVDPEIGAQVIPRGRDRYEIRLVPKLYMRCPPHAIIDAKLKDGVISFKRDGYFGEIRDNGTITGGRGTGRTTFEMKKVKMLSPNLGAAPPENAQILFDGTNLDAWTKTEGYKIIDGGVLLVTPDSGTMETAGKFTDVQLHVEFRLPYMPDATGQARGNSGVFCQDRYETQVLDSYGLEGYFNECGALYKASAPRVNACLPPLEWQSYDITYTAPRYNADGKLEALPRMTTYQNGVLIQNDVEIPWLTDWKEKDRLDDPPREPGSIKLQGHNNFVQYRNIWVVDLTK